MNDGYRPPAGKVSKLRVILATWLTTPHTRVTVLPVIALLLLVGGGVSLFVFRASLATVPFALGALLLVAVHERRLPPLLDPLGGVEHRTAEIFLRPTHPVDAPAFEATFDAETERLHGISGEVQAAFTRLIRRGGRRAKPFYAVLGTDERSVLGWAIVTSVSPEPLHPTAAMWFSPGARTDPVASAALSALVGAARARGLPHLYVPLDTHEDLLRAAVVRAGGRLQGHSEPVGWMGEPRSIEWWEVDCG